MNSKEINYLIIDDKINYLIVENEADTPEVLKSIITDWEVKVNKRDPSDFKIDIADSASAALRYFSKGNKCNILLLDIDLGEGKNGYDHVLAVLAKYGYKLPYTVIVTGANNRHIDFAYKSTTYDCIVGFWEKTQIISKAQKLLNDLFLRIGTKQKLVIPPSISQFKDLVIDDQCFRVEDILYFQADGHYTNVFVYSAISLDVQNELTKIARTEPNLQDLLDKMANSGLRAIKKVHIDKMLGEVEKLLENCYESDNRWFLKTHRSYIINKHNVQKIRSSSRVVTTLSFKDCDATKYFAKVSREKEKEVEQECF